MELAPLIEPADTIYRGTITDPSRWTQFQPRRGDVIVATPSKSGTTWTQSIVAMLLNGGPTLPDRLAALSPWIDANFVDIEVNLRELECQDGRRVIKTHTPPDGFPIWEDVQVIAVFRHPLEMFLSLRKHIANMKERGESALEGPIDAALRHFLMTPFSHDDADEDTIMTVTRHFEASVLSGRLPACLVLNYAAMLRDHGGAIRQLDTYLGTNRDAKTLADIEQASAFGAMKTNASNFAPEGGRGFWHDDQAFFASGQSGAWRDVLNNELANTYTERFTELLPNRVHRHWIETGEGSLSFPRE